MKFQVAAADRADRLVAARLPGRGRHALAQAFADGLVRANGRRVRKGDRLVAGTWVEVADLPGPEDRLARPQPDLELTVLYVDETLIALDKAAGMPSHPLEPGEGGTLANALVARFPECAHAGADPREAGLVHRLDAGTTGVIVAARDRNSWSAVRDAFRAGQVLKEYLALVVGKLDRERSIDAAIMHDRSGAGGVRVGERIGALPALTEVQPIEQHGNYTLVRCVTRTGRMHQVRAHLAWDGWPVVGDVRYGGPPAPELGGPFLHAARIELPHPARADRLVVTADLPAVRAEFVRGL